MQGVKFAVPESFNCQPKAYTQRRHRVTAREPAQVVLPAGYGCRL